MKINKILSTVLLILLTSAAAFAQCDDGSGIGIPGGDPDAGNPCPLDTWVIFLALGAVVLTTLYLYRKQKAINNIA
jgi:hypothetical protein